MSLKISIPDSGIGRHSAPTVDACSTADLFHQNGKILSSEFSSSRLSKFTLPQWAGAPQKEIIALNVTLNGETKEAVHLDYGDKMYYMFGRAPVICARGHGFAIHSPSLSRQHAVIVYHKSEGTAYLIDLDSANGTFLNENRIPPHLPQWLENKSTVRFGLSKLTATVRLVRKSGQDDDCLPFPEDLNPTKTNVNSRLSGGCNKRGCQNLNFVQISDFNDTSDTASQCKRVDSQLDFRAALPERLQPQIKYCSDRLENLRCQSDSVTKLRMKTDELHGERINFRKTAAATDRDGMILSNVTSSLKRYSSDSKCDSKTKSKAPRRVSFADDLEGSKTFCE